MKNFGYLFKNITQDALGIGARVKKVSSPSVTGIKKPTLTVTPTPTNTLEYCVNLVKKHDHESFLCTILIPDVRTRRNVFAIKAFNVEVALIRDQVTMRETGLGRLVFWREAVNELFKSQESDASTAVPHHPVILELSREVIPANVSKKWFINLIESREESMTDAPFQTMADLEKYCDKSVTPLFYLAFECLGLKSLQLDHAASHLGKAIGLTNFIRGIPYNTKLRRVLVPQELLLKNKLSQENFIRVDEAERIRSLVFEIAASAFAHYEKAKALEPTFIHELTSSKKQQKINPLPVLMSALPTKIYLDRLEKRDFNPYDPSLMKRYGLLPLRLYINKLTRKYF